MSTLLWTPPLGDFVIWTKIRFKNNGLRISLRFVILSDVIIVQFAINTRFKSLITYHSRKYKHTEKCSKYYYFDDTNRFLNHFFFFFYAKFRILLESVHFDKISCFDCFTLSMIYIETFVLWSLKTDIFYVTETISIGNNSSNKAFECSTYFKVISVQVYFPIYVFLFVREKKSPYSYAYLVSPTKKKELKIILNYFTLLV